MLVAVVGPSGAGKDTLMGRRARARGRSRFRFVQRAITRRRRRRQAHRRAGTKRPSRRNARPAASPCGGPRWAVLRHPRDIEGDLAAARVVVANLSRGVLAEAASRYRLRVLCITAPAEVLAARLAARGRESAADIAARLARGMALAPGLDVATVMNDAAPEDGAARVVAELSRAAADARRS